MTLDKQTLLEAASRGYYTPENSRKELDADLLNAIVVEILTAQQPESSRDAVQRAINGLYIASSCLDRRNSGSRFTANLVDGAIVELERALNNAGGQVARSQGGADGQARPDANGSYTAPEPLPVPPAPDAAPQVERRCTCGFFEPAPQEPTQHTANPVSDSPTPAEAASRADLVRRLRKYAAGLRDTIAPVPHGGADLIDEAAGALELDAYTRCAEIAGKKSSWTYDPHGEDADYWNGYRYGRKDAETAILAARDALRRKP